jgi:hypothetical protein
MKKRSIFSNPFLLRRKRTGSKYCGLRFLTSSCIKTVRPSIRESTPFEGVSKRSIPMRLTVYSPQRAKGSQRVGKGRELRAGKLQS